MAAMELSLVQKIIVWGVPLLFAITVHEVAHGFVAYLRGDMTAKMLGRLTLNPIHHIDPVGTILVPLLIAIATQFNFVFGWAKPVPVTWQNLKNPRVDMVLVALAGPFANLLMALGWAIIAKIGMFIPENQQMLSLFFILTGEAGILINLVLMVLNLIPIPPLDGSKIISSALPPRFGRYIYALEMYGFIIIALLIFTGLLQMILQPMVTFCFRLILQMFNL